jgi:hypothetical protein
VSSVDALHTSWQDCRSFPRKAQADLPTAVQWLCSESIAAAGAGVHKRKLRAGGGPRAVMSTTHITDGPVRCRELGRPRRTPGTAAKLQVCTADPNDRWRKSGLGRGILDGSVVQSGVGWRADCQLRHGVAPRRQQHTAVVLSSVLGLTAHGRTKDGRSTDARRPGHQCPTRSLAANGCGLNLS